MSKVNNKRQARTLLRCAMATVLQDCYTAISPVEARFLSTAFSARMLRLFDKFEKGTKEHGGNLFKASLEKETDNEILDLEVYTEAKAYAFEFSHAREAELKQLQQSYERK